MTEATPHTDADSRSPVDLLRSEIQTLADAFCTVHAVRYSTASKWALGDPAFIGKFLDGGNGTTQKLERLSKFLMNCPGDPEGRHQFVEKWKQTELLRD